MKKTVRNSAKIKRPKFISNTVKKKLVSFSPEAAYIYANKANSYLIHSIGVKDS